MPQIMTIARAVTDALADLDAELSVLPEYTLRHNLPQKVVVSPAGTESAPVSRAYSLETMHIRVSLLRHCLESEAESAADIMSAISARFPGKMFGSAVCTAAEYDPVLDAGFLREDNLFLATLDLTFLTIDQTQTPSQP